MLLVKNCKKILKKQTFLYSFHPLPKPLHVGGTEGQIGIEARKLDKDKKILHSIENHIFLSFYK